MSATKIMTATLNITETGVRTTADVILGGRAASLQSVFEAALQADPEGAADYRAVLAQIADRLQVRIDKEIDGSRDSGCCWYAVRLCDGRTDGVNGASLTRPMQVTRGEFRGWSPTAEQTAEARARILRRLVEIGLGAAAITFGARRTVADALAR